MSTSGKIKNRVRQLAGKQLFYLPPLLQSSPMIREIFVSDEVRSGVSRPWPNFRTGARHSTFRETLDHFTEGYRINISEDPFGKPSYAFLARTHPVGEEVWDIRCLKEDQGIRCFGCFGGKDCFIALTWDYRENITDFDAEVHRCRKQWDTLFPSIDPFYGRTLDEYLSNYVPL